MLRLCETKRCFHGDKNMKKLLHTHTDLDGLGCLLMTRCFDHYEYFDKVQLLNYQDYEESILLYEDIQQYSEVWFIDISPDAKLLRLLLDNNIKTVIIDHHESFYKELWEPLTDKEKSKIEYVYDNKKSGTLLSFEYYKKLKNTPRVPLVLNQIVERINAYDLWLDTKDRPLFEKGMDLNRIFWGCMDWGKEPNDHRKYDFWLQLMISKIDVCTNGIMFTNFEKQKITNAKLKEKAVLKKALKTLMIREDKKGRKFAIVKLASKVSVTAWTIMWNHLELSYIVVINEYNKENKKLSFRTRSDVDINLLELMHTKGHPKACGAEISQEDIERFWQGDIYDFASTQKDSLQN